jgi:GxxExxY protein
MNLELRNSGKETLRYQDLSGRIIAAAIAVHKALGPGFLESVYEAAFALELEANGIGYERQKTVPIIYRHETIGEHRLDFLVADSVVVELKAVTGFEKIHFTMVRSYLKATGLQDALLLNFAVMPLAIKRVGSEYVEEHTSDKTVSIY